MLKILDMDSIEWFHTPCKKCYYIGYDFLGKRPIVSFDFDDTLVYNDIWTKGDNGGKIMPNVKDKLNELYFNFDIVIFTNQNGIMKGKITHEQLQLKIDKFINDIGIPLTVFYSIDKDNFRKPNIGMYDLCMSFSNGQCIEYYCGDAAGRVNDGSKSDFSASDLFFANNANIVFKTPEEVFFNSEQMILADRKVKALELYSGDIWDNGKLANSRQLFDVDHIDSIDIPDFDLSKRVLIVMVGSQGSGKSTLSKEISELYDFDIVNNDTLKSKRLIDKRFKELQNKCNGIIIDNTNNIESIREYWFSLCKDWNQYVIHIDIEKIHSMYLCKYREFCSGISIPSVSIPSVSIPSVSIPSVAIHTYYKRFEEPDCNKDIVLYKYNKAIVSESINFKIRFY